MEKYLLNNWKELTELMLTCPNPVTRQSIVYIISKVLNIAITHYKIPLVQDVINFYFL